MYCPNLFLILSLALSASALSSPHMARNLHHRQVLAGRSPAAEASAAPVVVVPQKRVVKRCKASNGTAISFTSSSAALPTSTALSSVAVSSSSAAASTKLSSSSEAAQPTVAPVNVGGDLPVFSSSSAAPSPSHSADPAPSSAKPAAVEKPATTEEPSSTKAPATTQAPATTKAAPTTQAPPPASTPASSGGDGDLLTATHSGDATFYATGLGACGITNSDTDHIVAVSHLLFDTFPGYNGANPNDNPICNKKATAHYQGNSVQVTITDRCVGCAMFDLDFSPSAFDKLGSEAIGRLHGMTWTFD